LHPSRKNLRIDKRLIIGLLLTVGIALSFWLGSRYPDLNEKSMIGAERDLQGIAFDIVLPVSPDDPVWQKIAFTTVNWMDTNKKGMAFGLVFAACLLTVLGFFERESGGGLFTNTFKGFLIGAPMGLCVNCAAPVAYGLKQGGAKPETSLGAMLSSPSMNVVVIGMMFSLLPWYLAALKLVFSLGLIFVFVPLLVRLSPERWLTPKPEAADDCDLSAVCNLTPEDRPPAEWGQAVRWTVRMFLRNLLRLARQTVPLMLLAGLLGSTLITFMPFDLVQAANHLGEGNSRIPMLIALAVFGVFLPVPMAFDVVMVVMLMGLGIPTSFAMVLLLTLGSYSFYSYIIVAKAFSHPTALIITLAVTLSAIVAGLLAPRLQQLDRDLHVSMLAKHFKNSKPLERVVPVVPAARPWKEIRAHLDANVISFSAHHGATNMTPAAGVVRVGSFPFHTKERKEGPLFRRTSGRDWGIDLPGYFSIRKFVIYHQSIARGLASGDVHGDNYPDVLVCGDADIGGLYLFANLGGRGFARQALDLGEMNRQSILAAAMVDLNNDDFLDIVFTTLDDGNFVFLNNRGQFLPGDLHRLSHKPGTTALSLGFHDFDGNGWLDVFIPHYSIGHVAENLNIAHELSRNQMLYLDADGPPRAELRDMPELPGETHGAIVTDFNGDGHADLMCYNDWIVPDMLYLGSTNGELRKVGAQDKILPITTRTTMSIQSADIDNDLQAEFFFSENSKADQVQGKHNIRITLKEFEDRAASEEEREMISTFRRKFRVFRNKNMMLTYYFVPEELRQDWMAYHVVRKSVFEPDVSWAAMTPAHRTDVHTFLQRIKTPIHQVSVDVDKNPEELPQIQSEENVFLVRQPDGTLTNRAEEFGIHRAGWTWHAGFADLDHDEFQDLYIATGWAAYDTRDNNTFFHNRSGKGFELKTDEFGLTDYAATSAFNYVDFDRDGDLDVLSLPLTFAAFWVFENQGPDGNSLSVQLRDQRGNRHGIGSRIVVRYGEGGTSQQLREIRASGGFVSFDPLEAHFGLGRHLQATAIEVTWPDGTSTRLKGSFPANRCYRIERSR
jgi:uncharacterized membrane protein YraQ (UPF0718 family)